MSSLDLYIIMMSIMKNKRGEFVSASVFVVAVIVMASIVSITGMAAGGGDGNESGYGVMAVPLFINAINTSVDFKINHNFTANITLNHTSLDAYIFSTNATGVWFNTTVDISGSEYNASQQANVTIGQGQQVCWYYWANETSGENDSSSNYCFIVANTAPIVDTVVILPASPNTTNDLNCTNTTSDADSDTVTVKLFNWFKDEVAQNINNSILAAGNTTSGELWRCSINVTDGTDGGFKNSSAVTILDNVIPIFSSAINTSVDFKINHNFTANITIDDEHLNTYIFSTNATGSWVNTTIDAGDVTQINASYQANITSTQGEQVCWYYWVNDTSNNNVTSSNYCFTVQNTAPTVDTIAISPSSPNATVDLNCTYTATDDDSDTLTPTFEWYLSGVAQSINNQILALGNTTPGQTWNCSVNVTDTQEWDFDASAAVVIADESAPTFSSPSNTSVDFKINHNFTANITIDDYALDAYIFSTNATGSWVNVTFDISGVQYNASYNANVTVGQGQQVCWYYWVNDTSNNNVTSSNYCFTVQNTAPTVDTIAISPSSPNATVDLNCTYTATDDDSDTLTPTYDWYKDGINQSINNQILAAGNTTVGDAWNCSVNVSDGTEWSYLVSSAKTISDDSAPTFSSAVNTSADFKINSAFTANVTIDNANLTDYIFSTNASGSWVNASSSISGTQYNASSQTTISVANGVQVCWYYWASDDVDNNATSSTYCFTVVNSVPVQGTPTITGSSVNDNLVCTASATDADGENVNYNGRWYLNGTANTTFDTAPTNYTQGVSTSVSTLGSGNTSVGDVWSCEVRADDGTINSSYANSTNVTIAAVPTSSGGGGGGRRCNDECIEGEVICQNGAYYICGDYDSDTCTEWSVEECPSGSNCDEKTSQCVPSICVEDWICEDWDTCENGLQTRQCEDWNSCGTEEQKPTLTKNCGVEEDVEEDEVDEELLVEEKEIKIDEKSAPAVEEKGIVSKLTSTVSSIKSVVVEYPKQSGAILALVIVIGYMIGHTRGKRKTKKIKWKKVNKKSLKKLKKKVVKKSNKKSESSKESEEENNKED